MNSSQNSKLSVNTDKLKERLEKFKENSRRNSESNKIIPLVDWKEKRKDFLYRKMKKMEEEAGDRLAEKKIKVTLKTNRCTIF